MTVQSRGKTFQQLVQDAKTRIREVSQAEFRQWLADNKKVTVIDVREPGDFAAGAISNAVNVPRGILELEIDEVVPDQDQLVVLYCGGGSRSALAADTLRVMGYENVYSLQGGWKQWNQ